jgi:hypothetical protein
MPMKGVRGSSRELGCELWMPSCRFERLTVDPTCNSGGYGFESLALRQTGTVELLLQAWPAPMGFAKAGDE